MFRTLIWTGVGVVIPYYCLVGSGRSSNPIIIMGALMFANIIGFAERASK
jgi:hypothetical protein